MTFRILLTLSCTLFFASGKSQSAIFLSEGKIEFTKTVNVHARLDKLMDDEDTWRELMKNSQAKFKTTYFNLFFSGNQWLYKPGKENPDNIKAEREPAEHNIVIGDYDTKQSSTQKNIDGDLNVIQDSLRRIKWRITDENKVIAGFNCRRANAIIMDSIYVVAFYTDEIITPAGPESFTGLPGMILGVSLPHEHVAWFADKVETQQVPKNTLTPPLKGKKYDNRGFAAMLNDAVKNWGKWGRDLLIQAEL